MGGPPSEAREGGNRLRRATTLRKRGEIGLTPLPYPEQRIKRDNITFDRCPANRRQREAQTSDPKALDSSRRRTLFPKDSAEGTRASDCMVLPDSRPRTAFPSRPLTQTVWRTSHPLENRG